MPRRRRARRCCKNPADLLACCSAALLAPVLAGEHTQMLEGVCWQLAGRGARRNVMHTLIGVATRHMCPWIAASLYEDGARLTDLARGVAPRTSIEPTATPGKLCEPLTGSLLGALRGRLAWSDVRLQGSTGECTCTAALALLCHGLLSSALL